MNYLTSQAAIPEYQVRLKWRNNTVAMWDNLQVQHYAVADYGNAPGRCCATRRRTIPPTSMLYEHVDTGSSMANCPGCRSRPMPKTSC